MILTASVRNFRAPLSLFRIAVVAILALTGLPANARNQSDKPLNILLFTVDDLNFEAIPLLGGSTVEVTPNLDRFAKSAMSLDLSRLFAISDRLAVMSTIIHFVLMLIVAILMAIPSK